MPSQGSSQDLITPHGCSFHSGLQTNAASPPGRKVITLPWTHPVPKSIFQVSKAVNNWFLLPQSISRTILFQYPGKNREIIISGPHLLFPCGAETIIKWQENRRTKLHHYQIITKQVAPSDWGKRADIFMLLSLCTFNDEFSRNLSLSPTLWYKYRPKVTCKSNDI